ncbi:hypothetical protein DFJ43DRAFT_310094 [Lentinula guzmanii]|uniref:C2H2-type domain-containing protein n=1 Tax=Lentinula guzmanii TaxID=2804957 RepID=A0AA38N0U7_9AGAR|nr:hypothetical protein DFJ43DRAFT_310094 [Lentinula guzmanii]
MTPNNFIMNAQGEIINATVIEEESHPGADSGFGQLLTLPQVSAPTPEVQTGLFASGVDLSTGQVPSGISSFSPSASSSQALPWNSDSLLQESFHLNIPHPDSSLYFGHLGKERIESSENTTVQRFDPTLFEGTVPPHSQSLITHDDLSHALWSASNTGHQSLSTDLSFPYPGSLRLETDISSPEYTYPLLTYGNRWSAHNSPTSTPSSVSQSPSANTPSMLQYARHGLSVPESSYIGSTSSPASAASDLAFANQHSVDGDGGPFSFSRGRQHIRISRSSHGREPRRRFNASRSSSASSNVNHSPEIDWQRRRGPGETIQPGDKSNHFFASGSARARAERRGRLSDSCLAVAAPRTHDDSGIFTSKAKMWTLAQDTSTFDVDDDAPDGPEPVSPKKQVASDALVTAATGRRKNEATFHCGVPGCKATFTAKHNLNNHLNSHFGIKSFRCPRCERDFGTPHVLRRHQTVCKGKRRFSNFGQAGQNFMIARTLEGTRRA